MIARCWASVVFSYHLLSLTFPCLFRQRTNRAGIFFLLPSSAVHPVASTDELYLLSDRPISCCLRFHYLIYLLFSCFHYPSLFLHVLSDRPSMATLSTSIDGFFYDNCSVVSDTVFFKKKKKTKKNFRREKKKKFKTRENNKASTTSVFVMMII